jgi:hypothetical protein
VFIVTIEGIVLLVFIVTIEGIVLLVFIVTDPLYSDDKHQ